MNKTFLIETSLENENTKTSVKSIFDIQCVFHDQNHPSLLSRSLFWPGTLHYFTLLKNLTQY